MAFRLREVLLGNWRNKGVALFFAMTIWYVAYKAETQSDTVPVRLVVVPRPDGRLIIRQECQDARGDLVQFTRTVVLSVSGPRKLIEKYRGEGSVREVRLPVEASGDPDSDRKQVVLTDASFSPPPGVEITSIFPKVLYLTFDVAEEREFPVEPVYQRVPEGMETEPPKIEPSVARLQGPRSVLSRVRVVAEARLGLGETFEDMVDLNLRHPDSLDKALIEHVRFVGPSRVRMSVRLRYQSHAFEADGLRVRFLIPGAKFPYRLQFADETIAVKFQGPVQEIRRLQEKVKGPEFALAVQVPPAAGDGEQTITFTEDSLLLYGFSERVQILQHSQRRAQGKGAWTYTLAPPAPPTLGAK